MFDEENNVSDEMLAAYIDGNSSPIENLLIADFLPEESAIEVLDLSADCKNVELLSNVEPITFSDIVDVFVRPFKDYEELKDNIDTPDNSGIM